MTKEIYHQGWLIKSPPTKRIWRAVSSSNNSVCIMFDCSSAQLFYHLHFLDPPSTSESNQAFQILVCVRPIDNDKRIFLSFGVIRAFCRANKVHI